MPAASSRRRSQAISQKGWEAVVRTNLTGGFLMARECYTQWMRAHGGAIVNIVADMWNGMPGMGHCGAARAGMVNFTETAAVEWAASGVRVNAVAPGWIASSGFDTYPRTMRQAHAALTDADKLPLPRFGTESEVSAAIVFLLSPRRAHSSPATAARRRRRAQRQAPGYLCRPTRTGASPRRLPPRRQAEDAAGGVMTITVHTTGSSRGLCPGSSHPAARRFKRHPGSRLCR